MRGSRRDFESLVQEIDGNITGTTIIRKKTFVSSQYVEAGRVFARHIAEHGPGTVSLELVL